MDTGTVGTTERTQAVIPSTFRTTGETEAALGQAPRLPLFPGYYARPGQGTTWHHGGAWADTVRTWWTFLRLFVGSPRFCYRGVRQFYVELIHRLPFLSPRAARLLLALRGVVGVFGPMAVAPIAFLGAALPFIPKPKMFKPFSVLGLMNYCAMLAIVSVYHTNLRLKYGVSPELAGRYANKDVWRAFFERQLTRADSYTPRLHGVVEDHRLVGELPRAPFVAKPQAAGAGYKLVGFHFDAERGVYEADDPTYFDARDRTLDAEQLRSWLETNYRSAVLESWETCRSPWPTSSLRILTVRFGPQAELLSLALLVAPEGSLSTAHAEVHAYVIDVTGRRVARPVDEGFAEKERVVGLEIPELPELIDECLRLHEALPLGHVEVSWDILLTERGAAYL